MDLSVSRRHPPSSSKKLINTQVKNGTLQEKNLNTTIQNYYMNFMKFLFSIEINLISILK